MNSADLSHVFPVTVRQTFIATTMRFYVASMFLILLPQLTRAVAIDNGVQDVQLSCTETQISLSIVTMKPLFQPARIFVKGRSQDRNCMIEYPGDRISQRLVYQLPLSSCGMERTGRQGGLRGATFVVTYVVSFHPVFITKVDRAYRLICRYGGGTTDLTAGLSVSMIPTEPLQGFIGMAQCSYTVHKGSPSGQPVRYAKVGEKIFHVWRCTNLTPTQYIWVHDCFVSPEFGTGELIIDSKGCTTDPVVIGELDYGRQPFHLVVGNHHAYKFPEYPTLLWRCSISVCDSANTARNCRLPDGSVTPVPPVCGRLRQARNVNSRELSQLHLLSKKGNSTDLWKDSEQNLVATYDVITDPLELFNPEDNFVDSDRADPGSDDQVESESSFQLKEGWEVSRVCLSQISFAFLMCSTGLLLLVVMICAYLLILLQRRGSYNPKILRGSE